MPLKAKIESDEVFNLVEADMDYIALLIIIRSINFAVNAEKNPNQALYEAKRSFTLSSKNVYLPYTRTVETSFLNSAKMACITMIHLSTVVQLW